MSQSDDMVYLLSITFASYEDKGGSIWIEGDDSNFAHTKNMGMARAWDTEKEAEMWRNEQNFALTFQITPIARKRYFKAKLAGRTL